MSDIQVKKAFVELYEFLEANKNKKVSTVLPELYEMVKKSKNSGSETGRNFIKDEDGNVIAVFCYYHKQWELVANVEYGKKASNASTGLNTMCKKGVSAWSKQQRDYVKNKDELLNSLLAGNIEQAEMRAKLDDLNVALKHIIPLSEQVPELAEFTALELSDLGL